MCTIIRKPNGTYEIRYVAASGKKRSIYPGRIPAREAENLGSKIDHIVNRLVLGSEPSRDIARWLELLPDKLYSKLVKHGLAPARAIAEEPAVLPDPDVPTIKQWTDRYIANHPADDATIEQLTITARNLIKHFGEGKELDSFTAGDAEDYRKWMLRAGNERKSYKSGLAPNTVRRRIGRCKQFFNAAVKHQLIGRNPFADEPSTVTGNQERLFLVPAESIEACIREAPCEDWRIILAFARYAGMRSHETRIQRWEDIDLPNSQMVVRSNKTPARRLCPIFPELRPHLLRAKEMAPEGAEYVQTRYRHDDNILTQLRRILTAAELVPWPKLMQNMRATRETELLAHYPAKDVTSWLGNSPTIAANHYAMPMQASFNRAISDGAQLPGVTRGVPQKTPPKTPPTLQDKASNAETEEMVDGVDPTNNWVCLAMALADLPLSCPTRT